MSERFDCTVRLRRLYGMRGYGVYCRVAEITASAPEKKIKYDVDDLAYDMREEPDFIRQVVEEFGLFVIEDGWLEDAFNRSPEAKERERQEQIKRNRSEGARKAAATRKAKKEAAQTQTPTPAPILSPDVEPVEFVSDESARFDWLKEEWNKRFRRSRRGYFDLTPDPITWKNFRDSSAIYGDADYRDAFDQALADQKFAWQFRDVLKPSNMQRLLSAYEMEQKSKEEMTEDQKELIEYADKHGLNWDDFN